MNINEQTKKDRWSKMKNKEMDMEKTGGGGLEALFG